MIEIKGLVSSESFENESRITGGGDSIQNKGIFSKAFSFVDNHYATVGLLPGNAYTYNITTGGNYFYYAKFRLSGPCGIAGSTEGSNSVPYNRTAEIEIFAGAVSSIFMTNMDTAELNIKCYGSTLRIVSTLKEPWYMTNHVEGYTCLVGRTPWGNRAIAAHTNGQETDKQAYNITSQGQAYVEWGNSSAEHHTGSTASDGVRGVFMGDWPPAGDGIDVFSITTASDAVDFGELAQGRSFYSDNGYGDGNRGFTDSGSTDNDNPGIVDTIECITIGTLGDATDYAEANLGSRYNTCVEDGVYGSTTGGISSTEAGIHHITIFNMVSRSNSDDFGAEITAGRYGAGGASSGNRQIMFSGYQPPAGANVATIDYFTLRTVVDAADFGDLSNANHYNSAATSNGIRAVQLGGIDGPGANKETIEYVNISTIGDATDFGELKDQSGVIATSGG